VSQSRRPLRPPPAWATRTGLVRLASRPPVGLDAAQALQDRLHRYCWGFDERRHDVLVDTFTADAVWVGDVMGETSIGPHRGRDAVLSWLAAFWEHQRDQRRHVVTNFVLEEMSDTTATAMAYLLLLGASKSSAALEAAGLYRVEYRLEQDGAWRISHLTAGFDAPFWKTEVESMEPWVRELFGITRHEPPTS
jgi:ketosteroid isomerase-like protein